MRHARPAFLILTAATALAGCATTPAGVVAPWAQMADCEVVMTALDAFSRPLDGPLLVNAIAQPENPPFLPQKPEQRSPGPFDMSSCQIQDVEFVASGGTVTLGRPEIHDESVIVPYREQGGTLVHAELERTPQGFWRHKSAYLAAPVSAP